MTNKKGLKRARDLPIVQVALKRRTLAVSTTTFPKIPLVAPFLAPAALPPPPYLSSIEYPYGVFLTFIDSFESSSEAKVPSTPIGPDVS